MVIEEHSTSSNLVFSVGSWQNVVNPSVEYWKSTNQSKECHVGDYVIQVGGVKSGKESYGKVVKNQVIFYADREKVVTYTTQRSLYC